MRNLIVSGLAVVAATLLNGSPACAEVYKIVAADGTVTYTDQAPADGSAPMDLPELSVIETDIEPLPETTPEAEESAGLQPPTLRELRRMYGDFRITQPAPEETFWGTGNTVVARWESSAPISSGMSVRLFVDGQAQAATQQGTVTLTLERGEHKIYAELLNARGRRIVTSDTVTFHVKQYSANFNQQNQAPINRP